MAYPTVSAPYGLVPVKMVSGTPYAGVTRQYTIASGYGTNIFTGDAVKLVDRMEFSRANFLAVKNWGK